MRRAAAGLACFLLLLAAGCARTSPAAGVWAGEIQGGGPLASVPLVLLVGEKAAATTLTLRRDGTGFLKLSAAPEQPISWTEEDNKVILRGRNAEKRRDTPLVATLSPDRKTLTVDLGPFTAALRKQPEPR